MDKIKTSELISKLALASEEACKCEDINFEFAFHGAIKKDMNDFRLNLRMQWILTKKH